MTEAIPESDRPSSLVITYVLGAVLTIVIGFHTLFIAPIIVKVDKLELKHSVDVKELRKDHKGYAAEFKQMQINQALILSELKRLTREGEFRG